MAVNASGTVRGNVSLSGTTTIMAEPMIWSQNEVLCFGRPDPDYYKSSEARWSTLTIEGSLTLGPAAVSFVGDLGNLPSNLDTTDVRPDSDHPVIICSSLSGSLSGLIPFAIALDDEEDIQHVQALANYGFQAVTADDGLTYIYLTKNGETPTGPSSAAFEAKTGDTLTLTDGDNLSKDDKLKINGGTADVSGISSALNNEMIIGTSAGGTLVTADTQTMELSKAGSISYDIVGSNGGAAAALLVKSDVTLKGDQYASNDSKVTLITIGSGDLTSLEDIVTFDDKTGYLENLQVFTDATSLSITADLSEAAQELLLQGGIPEPTADTMWASRALVRDFAHTAEQQMIIGAPGQTTVWGAALGSFVHMNGEEGFIAENGGGAVGVQHAFTEHFRAGVALGQSFGSFRTKDHFLDVDQRGTMFGATAQYVGNAQHGVSAAFNGHISIGSVRNEGTFDYGEGYCTESNWDDRVLSVGSRASLWMFPSEDVTVLPFIGLEYQRVVQSNHTEADGEYSIRYTDGANLLIDTQWSVGVFYHLEARENATSQSCNASVRYSF